MLNYFKATNTAYGTISTKILDGDHLIKDNTNYQLIYIKNISNVNIYITEVTFKSPYTIKAANVTSFDLSTVDYINDVVFTNSKTLLIDTLIASGDSIPVLIKLEYEQIEHKKNNLTIEGYWFEY